MENKEDNRFDLDIRAILENGQEEVPVRIWDDLAPRLDIMAEERRRKTFLRWMRYTTAVASVAAVIAIALVFPWGAGVSFPDTPHDSIAIIEPEEDTVPEERYIAMAEDRQETAAVHEAAAAPSIMAETVPAAIPSSIDDTFEPILTEENADEATEATPEPQGTTTELEVADSMEDMAFSDFDEKTTKEEEMKVSITMSGNALSNSKSRKSGTMPMRAPGMPGKSGFRELSESTYGIPLSFGIGARIEFTTRWSMSAGLNYTLLTRTFRGTYTDNDGIQTPETSIVNNQSYIGIPVNVYFNIISRDFVDFYAYAGGAMEKCMDNRFLLKDTNPNTIHQKASGLQWSANIGLGAEFILTDWLGLYIDPSLRYYFKGNQPKSIRTQQPLSLGFELGFRVRL